MPALHGAMPVLVELLGATDSCPERNRTITITVIITTAIITTAITITAITITPITITAITITIPMVPGLLLLVQLSGGQVGERGERMNGRPRSVIV
jgi:hypothetical protein